MKQFFFLCMTALALSVSSPVFSADENKEADDESKMTVEKIIASCESQYTADLYPDTEERNKLVDQCVEESSANVKE